MRGTPVDVPLPSITSFTHTLPCPDKTSDHY
jgi:hypothetical protein